VHTIGWTEARYFADEARAAVGDGIIAPLARYGIEIPKQEVEALLA
jgi:hypothetical protein